MYAFHNLVKVHALRDHDDTDWLQSPPKLLLYQLRVDRSSPNNAPRRDSSRAFRAVRHKFLNLADMFAQDETFRQAWARWEPHRASVAEQTAADDDSLGIVPIKFMVEGAGDLAYFTFVHLYRSQARFPSEEAKEIVLEGLRDLLVGSINGGFPLRAVDDDPAVPGLFVRTHGNWTWLQLFPGGWDAYQRGVHEELDRTVDRLGERMSPALLLEMVEMW